MFTKKTLFKLTLILLFTSNAYTCPIYEDPIPIADAYVEIDSQKSKTSFSIVWEFNKDFVEILFSEHDKNKNGKFEKAEQEDIENEWLGHLKANNYITDIVYVEKGSRIRKKFMSKINPINSDLVFDGTSIKYYYSFDTEFIIEKDHRLFVRFLDPTEKVNLILKDISIKNYDDKKVILPQDIRANIYFYDHKVKYHKKKKVELPMLKFNDHEGHKHK